MNVMLCIMCGAAGFFAGFSLGLLRKAPYKSPKKRIDGTLSEELQKLRQEYRNFLEYDGSEQS